MRSLTILLLCVFALSLQAQEASPQVNEVVEEAVVAPEKPIEEIVVIGRYKAAATDVISERMDASVPVDMLDAEAISRVGDGDVAAALRRIPGLTLAQNKYVYVRGLGERYSSAQLNSAAVPSPDLTRNVLPPVSYTHLTLPTILRV